MSHQEYTIRNVGDLTSIVKGLREETNHTWWFRGHARAGWKLVPGVRRNNLTPQQERYMSTEFRTRARMRHSKCPEDEDLAGWLSLMPHYGLPTRLLDWSRSPLIASFFAALSYYRGKEQTGDADIWVLLPAVLNQHQGFRDLIYPLNYNRAKPLLRRAFRSEDVDEDGNNAENADKILAASPIETDLRMLIQQAGFTVHGSDLSLSETPGCEHWLRKIIVPEDAVQEISYDLDAMSIKLADLFPDLGDLAKELKDRQLSYARQPKWLVMEDRRS